MREAVSSVSIACFLFVVYTYSASIFWAIETVGFLGLWLAVSALVIAPFTAVFLGYLWLIEWQKNNDHRRDIEWQKTQIDELKIVTEAQKKTPLLAGGERPKLSINSPILEAPKAPELLDLIETSQHLIVVGGSGSGKSEVTKWIVSKHQKHNRNLMIIDPHSPSKILGVDTIGAKNNIKEIEQTMLMIMADINHKYRTGNISQNGDLGELNRYLIIDEMKKIRREIPEIYSDFMHAITIDSRKCGYYVQLNYQSLRDILKGDRDLLNDFAIAKLSKSLDNQTYSCKFGKFDSLKAELIDARLPGVFSGYPTTTNVVSPPDTTLQPAKMEILRQFAKVGKNEMSQNDLLKLAKVGRNSEALSFAKQLLEGRYQ